MEMSHLGNRVFGVRGVTIECKPAPALLVPDTQELDATQPLQQQAEAVSRPVVISQVSAESVISKTKGAPMVDLTAAVSQMAVLLIVTAVGFLATKIGYLDAEVRGKMSMLVNNITLPCMIVASAGALDASALGGQVVLSLGLGALAFFAMLAAGYLCAFILRVPAPKRCAFAFMSYCSNLGFLGIPVIAALYGDQTVLFSSIFIMGQATFFYSIGLAILAGSDGGSVKQRLKDALRSVANPSMAASVIALVLVFANVQLPMFAEDALDMLGGLTAPLAMMMVGVIVANSHLREVVGEWRIYPFIAIRHFLLPLGVYCALAPLVADTTILGLATVMLAMPVGSLAPMFAEMYGHDGKLVAKGTILSTIASFVLIPLLVALVLS